MVITKATYNLLNSMINLLNNKDGKTCLHHYVYGDNDLVCFIDEDGNWVIEPKFDDTFEFNKGKGKVVLQGNKGYIVV